MSIDLDKVRRENMRWQVMLVLNAARPVGAFEETVLSVLQSLYPDATAHELRLHLDYLEERLIIKLERQPGGRWFADLTRLGVDITEYTVDCQPGIARPAKYW